jgi:hypothetical protein
VIELTITSLHALAVKNGVASSKYAAATQAILETVAVSLQQAGSEDVMLQVRPAPRCHARRFTATACTPRMEPCPATAASVLPAVQLAQHAQPV